MKNKIGEIFFGRNTKLSGLLALGIVMLISLGCLCDNKKAGSIPAAYLGDWQGQDGTTISLRSDGGGDYKSGGSNVTNGTAEVNEAEKTLSIKLIGMGRTFKIDQPPVGNQMTLDGMIFRRKGGFSDTTSSNSLPSNSTVSSPTNKSPFPSDDSSTNGSQEGLPSSVEMETMVKATMSEFTSAIEEGDFTDFLKDTTTEFQAQNSPEKMNTAFQSFIDNKNKILPMLREIDSTSVNFIPPPSISSSILSANGSFSTTPYPTNFEMDYKQEKGKWKIQRIRVKIN